MRQLQNIFTKLLYLQINYFSHKKSRFIENIFMKERKMLDNVFDNFQSWSYQLMTRLKDLKLIKKIIEYKFNKFIGFVFSNLFDTFFYGFEKSKFLLLLNRMGIELFDIFQPAINRTIVLDWWTVYYVGVDE